LDFYDVLRDTRQFIRSRPTLKFLRNSRAKRNQSVMLREGVRNASAFPSVSFFSIRVGQCTSRADKQFEHFKLPRFYKSDTKVLMNRTRDGGTQGHRSFRFSPDFHRIVPKFRLQLKDLFTVLTLYANRLGGLRCHVRETRER
jgi:hypothetical protein